MSHRTRVSLFGLGGLVLVVCATAAIGLYAYRIKPPEAAAEQASAPALMDEAQRQYLWEIEHHGLLLSKQGFSRLADALTRQDAAALTAILAPRFKGDLPYQPREVRADTDYADVVREEPGAGAPAEATPDQFVGRLLKYRALFTKPPKVQFALMTLSPVQPGRIEGVWEGKGQLRLAGEMGRDNPGEVILTLKYRTPRPSRAAFRAGGWLRFAAIEQAQTARSRRGFLMREVAEKWGVDVGRFHDNWRLKKGTPPHVNTGGVYLCDYDRDGVLDMLITDPKGIALYRGQIKDGQFHFVDVTEDVGLPRTKPEALRGGDAEANAAALKSVLQGRKGPYRDIAVFNAAAALVVAAKAGTLADGVKLAQGAIDSGEAEASLERLIAVSNG